MKKKVLMVLGLICFILPIAFMLTGCQSTDYNEPITIPTDFNINMENEPITIPTDLNINMESEKVVQHRITIINDSESGTIYPKLENGNSYVLVDEGASYTVTIKAKEGFKLDYLLINSAKVDAVDTYTITNISTDYTVSAVFSEIIDRRHFITEIEAKGMIFDLFPTSNNQEVESLGYRLDMSAIHEGGNATWFSEGYVYCGKSSESRFTNSLTFSGFDITFNDEQFYTIELRINNLNVLNFSFIPNKMDLEHVSDNVYMMKLKNLSASGYNLQNIVLYFSASFE